ncbi:transglutaminase-like domain-containing protein [Sandaracinus amylolyticus]|uniref:transglutaminase-like domain-containing protein n=1 Tax=Sandaracinus amylolyticus TaxID=927083 RepID=UPI001F450C75|nr:transglutaminase-like domain-containing protein [Sandaracinus amylolyticus]UJR79884.1 Transglutaminase domain-containing protein [Sandaracinus amylolyticus]
MRDVREPALSTMLRMIVYALTAGVFAWPLSVAEGVIAAAIGGGLGSLVGRRLASTRVRTPVVMLGALVALGVSLAFADLVVGSGSVASMLGPSLALRAGEAAAFGLGALVLGTAVRLLSARRRSLAVIEIALIATSFAALVVAHRNYAIHRPFEIADWFLVRGGNPEYGMLGIGALAGLVIGLLLLSERSFLRSAVHLGVAACLLALILGTTAIAGLPPPQSGGDGLNLRNDTGRAEREAQGQGQSQGGAGGPDFQDEYDQSGSQTPLAIALLHDDYSPPSGVYYFRQESFSQYNGRRLIAAGISGVDDDVASGFPTRTIDIPGAPDTGAWRTTVETTVGLLAEHPRPFGLESPIQLVPVENPDRGRFRRTYRVRSAVLTSDEWGLLGRTAGSPTWSEDIRAHYTRGPSDPRYGELAQRILGEVPEDLRVDPIVQAFAITQWLGREGTYSLRSRHASADDPTAHFLFGDLTGYCVHFAHAAVYLMRAAGLPARVSTGYMVPESSRRGGSAILIAGGNSHAWPEVYLDGVGWVVVDVVPERSLDPPPGPADEALQQLLAEMLRGLRPLPEDGSEAPRAFDQILDDVRGPLAIGLAALIGTLVLLGYAIKVWRRLSGSVSPSAHTIYRAAIDQLASSGVVREWGESREAFAWRVRRELPSLAKLTTSHAAVAWGSKKARDDARGLLATKKELGRELAKTIPWWRRALGALNPYSWLLSR